MDLAYEAKYHQLEEQHWWFTSRRNTVFDLVQRMNLPPDTRILEIGCSGGPLQFMLRKAGFQHVTGIDVSEPAIALAKHRGLTDVHLMDGAHLKFPDASFDLVIASDVLEHIENDAQATREWARVLRPGGQMVVFVPAFQQLWSQHDVVNHHFRRYTGKDLRQVLEAARLHVSRVSFWNMALVFPTALMRMVQRRLTPPTKPTDGGGDLHGLPGPLNNLLSLWLRGENALLRRLNFPVGVSVFAVAQKKA